MNSRFCFGTEMSISRRTFRMCLWPIWAFAVALLQGSFVSAHAQDCAMTAFSMVDNYVGDIDTESSSNNTWSCGGNPNWNPQPQVWSGCGAMYLAGWGGGCILPGTLNVSCNLNSGGTGCQVNQVQNAAGQWFYEVSQAQNDGLISLDVDVSGECSGNNPGQCSATGYLQVDTGNGKCSCASGASGFGGCSGGVGSIDFRIFLGPASAFFDAGYIWLNADMPSTNLATRAGLQVPFSRPNVLVLTNAGAISQVKVPMGLVIITNITPPSAYSYRIECYASNQVFLNTNGFYGIQGTNTPFVTYLVQNPDAGTASNRLWITEERPGISNRVFEYTYSDNGSTILHQWSLLEPDGVTTISKWRVPNSTIAAITNFYYQVTSGSNVVRAVNATVQAVPIVNNVPTVGVLTNSIVEGTGSATQTTTFTYYPTNAPTGSANRLQRVDNPDGSWAYFMYDGSGRITNEFSAYLNYAPPSNPTNQPNPSVNPCKITSYSYAPVSGSPDDGTGNPFIARQVTVSVPVSSGGSYTNVEVSRLYRSLTSGSEEDQQCTKPGAAWDDSGNLTTITYYDASMPGIMRPLSICRPDGTATVYNYSTDGTNFTTTESTGAPDYWAEPSSITDGTTSTTLVDQFMRTESVTATDIVSTIQVSRQNYYYSSSDPLGRDYSLVNLAGLTNVFDYACCGLSSTTDPDGVVTEYTYDSLRRAVATSVIRGSSVITTTNVLDSVGQTLATKRIGTDLSTITLRQAQYDALGRVVSQTNALNGVTTYGYGVISSQQYDTNTYADGGTKITQCYRDGRIQSVTGTAVAQMEYVYGAEQDTDGTWRQFTTEIKLDGRGGTNEWVKTYVNAAGRAYKHIYAVSSGTNPFAISYFNNNGQLTNDVDADGVSTLYAYDDQGRRNLTIVNTNQSYTIDWGYDRITLVTNDVASDHGYNVRRQQTLVWSTNGANASDVASVAEASTDGLNTWQTRYRDPNTPVITHTQKSYGTGGSRSVTTTNADNSYTIESYSYGLLNSVTKYDSGGDQIAKTTYAYDPHDRPSSVTDARNGATTYSYNSADLIAAVTTPNPGTVGGLPETTSTYYDLMLRVTNVVQPDGTTVNTQYLPTGQILEMYGSRAYPVGYSYDAQGRMKTMTNWSGFSAGSGTGARVTTWNYDGYRGFLTNKTYDGNSNGPSYCYTAAGRLATRVWARGVVTTNRYDTAGSLIAVSYSDSTPGITYTYDRLGRQSSIVCNGMTTTLAYDNANNLLAEVYTGGTLGGLAITNAYDQFLRRAAVGLSNQPTALVQYGYDAASRLLNVTNGASTATYSYVANSPLVSQIVFSQSGTNRMITTKQYDYLNRLTSISSAPSAASALSFSYSYNAASQRTRDTLADNSYWSYAYDSLGQVTSGHKFWSDETPVAGEQFDYAFDTIGNRTQTRTGGDQNGANQRTANYYANTLNQYTNRDVPGYVDIKGDSIATNSVTVAGQVAYRKGEYFRSEVGVNNTSAAIWSNITVAATGQSSISGDAFIPQTAERFSYDADGNLTEDGRWNYTWDAENRLIAMCARTSIGPTNSLKFEYDANDRRIRKQVWANTNCLGTATNDLIFAYDGWNLIAVVNSSSTITNSFVWGADLSHSGESAGGVGGLLQITFGGSQKTNCFVVCDGSGNVRGLLNAADGSSVATYEYGPAGETIRVTGPLAKSNPLRFSSRYQDEENDLVYFGYRYFNSSSAKWLSRDPMEELGGPNLYAFFREDANDFVDVFGLGPSALNPPVYTDGPLPNPVLPPNMFNGPPGFPPNRPPNVPPSGPPGGSGSTGTPIEPPSTPGAPPQNSQPPSNTGSATCGAIVTIANNILSALDQKMLDAALAVCKKQRGAGCGGCCIITFCQNKCSGSFVYIDGSYYVAKPCSQVDVNHMDFISGCNPATKPVHVPYSPD